MRAACLALALLASPALADDPIVMTFVNQSLRVANISGVYALRNGVSIDDNLGSSDLFAPGQTITLPLVITRCTTVEVYAWLGDTSTEDDAEEIRGETDLCRNRTLILHD